MSLEGVDQTRSGFVALQIHLPMLGSFDQANLLTSHPTIEYDVVNQVAFSSGIVISFRINQDLIPGYLRYLERG